MMAQPTNILRANLKQLSRTEPEMAARIEEAQTAPLLWSDSKTGPLTASIDHDGRKLSLASRFDPMAEADKLNAALDPTKHAAAVYLGMGLGYHVAKAAEQLNDNKSLVIVYEPNVSLLRAVLEKIDHTAWLGRHNVILADSTMDRSGLLGRIEGFGSIMTQGTQLITHPTSRQLDNASLNAFGSLVTEVLAFFRTNVATALVNSSRTVRNYAMNIAYYGAGHNTNELYQAAVGYPAVCVGAGPSLAKNIDLLSDPAVRRCVVVISAQTTLKPLLARGIRPDFVTALDYHAISARFYEGLTAFDDITLVAESKANATILDSFPGPIRVTNSSFMDRMLGDLARPITPIQSGATVAHLSFYLAQYLGCDPIMLIGQDLGFSDGLYYCPGTVIHDVWAPELNSFNTLEMMEWQRIVRHRGLLSRQEDMFGKPIFTDEQMLTYLKQFERDFAKAPQQVIDCTEGGLPIANTSPLPFAQALEAYATRPVPPHKVPPVGLDQKRLSEMVKLLEHRLAEIEELRRLSQKTIPLLEQMKKHQRDFKKAHEIHDRIEKNKKRVDALNRTFALVNDLNTIGAFKRARADRAIHHQDMTEYEVQARQIDRDIENLQWLVQACEEGQQIFNDALKRTRELYKQQKNKTAVRAG
jgi:hypothetical protein